MLLSIFAMALVTGTTALGDIALQVASTGLEMVEPSLLLAAAAFFSSPPWPRTPGYRSTTRPPTWS